jgi:hypothetical protein
MMIAAVFCVACACGMWIMMAVRGRRHSAEHSSESQTGGDHSNPARREGDATA